MADRVVPELVEAARQSASAGARRAAEVLEAWDRTADSDSRGAVLFYLFARELQSRRLLGDLFRVTRSEIEANLQSVTTFEEESLTAATDSR